MDITVILGPEPPGVNSLLVDLMVDPVAVRALERAKVANGVVAAGHVALGVNSTETVGSICYPPSQQPIRMGGEK